jgi:RNA polymerase sigma-70 factor (ECF subfamily)
MQSLGIGQTRPGSLDGEELRDLMIRYQAADPASVESLVVRLSPTILRFVAAAGLTRGEAEDVLQDFWLRLHRARHTYRPSEPVLPWIFAIANHARLDAYRRRRRIVAHEVNVPSIPENLYQTLQPDVVDGEFLRALDSLPESQREVVIMLKVSGMSLEEVARAASASIGAIKQRAHRAYNTLRVLLTQQSPANARSACPARFTPAAVRDPRSVAQPR